MAAGPFSWLRSRERFGVKLGLDAMRTLLAELGDPHLQCPSLLVAGTNGKGSCGAMTAALLTASGCRTVLYTSPHIAHPCERIRVDGRAIRRDVLGRRLDEVRAAVRRLARGRRLRQQPTYFEVMTAAALLHAQRTRADCLVFEVGLGGRYDATNVLPAAVAVITSIDRDHTEYLGRTLERIAWNKAGIIKPGQRVLTAETRPSLVRVFRHECRRRQARLVVVPRRSAVPRGDTFDLALDTIRRHGVDGIPERVLRLKPAMRGPHMGTLAALAVGAAGSLLAAMQQPPLRAPVIRRALAATRLPGRFDIRRLTRGRLLVADGAHNPAAAQALARNLRAFRAGRPLTLLYSSMADKDARSFLEALRSQVDSVILTQARNRRSLPLKDLASHWPGPCRMVARPEAALTEALRLTPAGGLILVTGSFYLLGDLWPRMSRWPVAG